MSLGTKFYSFQMTRFWLFFGFWSFGRALHFLFFFFCAFSLLSFVGVHNALIKGEIANTMLICALIVHFVMSDCQRDP